MNAAADGHAAGQIEHVTYDGARPADDEIRAVLGLEGDYLYIVATAEQERRRRDLASDRQQTDESPVLKFDQVVRHEMGVPVLTKTEDRICLRRAIELATQDERVASFVRHDVFTWLDALQRLAQEGVDLSNGIPDELADELVSQEVAELLVLLQTAHIDERSQTQLPSFEEAFCDWMDGFIPPPIVVMDGFTYLFPLQRRFVDRCMAAGTRVVLVYPFRQEQRRGFAVMERTYAPYPDASGGQQFATLPLEVVTDLEHIQQWLFADGETVREQTVDGTVEMSAYTHRHQEVAACVEQVARHLEEGATAHDLAVVMRQPGEFQGLLQEEARRRGLDAVFAIEPRQLLLTPLGRFVLTLYEINRTGTLQITPDQFETMLASGWLGSMRQNTVDQLAALRPQLFERCRSLEDWHAALQVLEQLQGVGGEIGRLATLGLDTGQFAARWRDTLRDIEGLCRRLFGSGGTESSIGAHVERLLDELTRFDPGDFRAVERELVERVTSVLRDLESSGSMALSSEEFGDVLNSMIKEYETDPEAGQEAAPPSRIWLTTPEGIDGAPRPIVFYLGLDDHRVPRPPDNPWPRFVDRADENQERERYLFLTVVRAATEKLYLSYAKRGEKQSYRASLYFDAVCRLLNAELVTAPPPVLDSASVERTHQRHRSRRERYQMHELAIFGLCPYRYLLERLDHSARRSRDGFQLRFVAQGHWFAMIYEQVLNRRTDNAETFREMLQQAVVETENEVRPAFCGLRDTVWREIADHVRNQIDKIVDYDRERIDEYGAIVERGPSAEYVFDNDDFTVSVDAELQHVLRLGHFRRHLNDAMFFQHWMLPQIGEHSNDRRISFAGMTLFSDLYHASQWWQESARIALNVHNAEAFNNHLEESRRKRDERCVEIRDIISQIEAGDYPKHPGDHCQVCPARHACLGIAE